MKFKTTLASMRTGSTYRVGYCDLQALLSREDPIAYNSGIYGWNCDFYELRGSSGRRIYLSTGYRPIGKKINYKLVDEFEKKAESLREKSFANYEHERAAYLALIAEFVDAVLGEIEEIENAITEIFNR